MKKSNKILAGFLAGTCVVGGGFALAGCGEPDFMPTKIQVAEAVSAMANELVVEDAVAGVMTLSTSDYIEVENSTELLRVCRMGVLVSEICKNEGFELTFDAFDGYINDRGIEFNIKMKFEYENEITKFEFLLFMLGGVQGEQNVYYEYLTAEIDYDYENQLMKGFVLEDYMITMDESNHLLYSSDSLKRLDETSDSYVTAKNLLVSEYEEFKEEEYIDTEYDFSEEYATAMGLN